ncbi:hypothetical protein [Streptomyces sp. NPDC048489]|uniref:hypothetical protein n=1 Tax=Streptomyces sp. NPDC048489 TaxID=3154504 RepID=UPI0034337B8E
MVLHAVALYQAAAWKSLPRPVRVAAAGVLEVIELSQDVKRSHTAVWTLNEAVCDCGPGFISLQEDQIS